MWTKDRIRQFSKRILAPVTIMFIPHQHAKHSFNLNLPMFMIPLAAILCVAGVIYIGSATMDMFKYQRMEDQLRDYTSRAGEFNAALNSVKKLESDLKTMLSYGSKNKIIENVENADMGTMDIYQVHN